MSEANRLAVAAENVVKHFKTGNGTVKAVDGVSFCLPHGKMVALRGPSGCGKTTLLNLLGALDRPTSGRIVVHDVDLSVLRGPDEVAYRRHKVGFVFQAFNLLPQLSALENVMLPMEFAPGRGKERQAIAGDLLKRVGIGHDRYHYRPAKLSGGEQQRAAIARALANNPGLILADEPTGNLDSKTGLMIIGLLHEMSQEGRTVIIATHDETMASKADLVLEMVDGRLVSGI